MSCSSISTNPALTFVDAGYSQFVPVALNTVNMAQAAVAVLSTLSYSGVQFAANFDFDGELNTFHKPTKPVLDDDLLVLDTSALEDVEDAPEFDPNVLDLEASPRFDTTAPVFSAPQKPQALTATPPSRIALPYREAPVEPDYVMPDVPPLELVDLPTRPDIAALEFTAVPPNVTLPELIETWGTFTPQAYVSALLDKVRATISTRLDGGTGLPAAVEEALWGRGRARVNVEEERALVERVDLFATRGFTEPNSILSRALEQVRQTSQDQRNTLAREISIKQAELEQANLQNAVQQGIALEGVTTQLFVQTQQLELASAQFGLEAAMKVFDAKIGVIRLQYDVFKVEAEVFEARIRAEQLKIEIYRTDMEAAKLRGELNDQLVRRYESQIRAVAVMAEFYNTRVNAFRGLIEADTSLVEQYRAEVGAFAELVRAKSAEWDGYKTAVDAQDSQARVFDTLARAFATRVSSVNERNRLELDKERLRLEQYRATRDSWGDSLNLIRTRLGVERDRVATVGSTFGARAGMYASEAQVETAAAAARDRTFQLGLERERARVQVALQDAQMRIEENLRLSQFELSARQTVAQVLAQLAAALSSAVSFSAGVTSSMSDDKSCSGTFD